MKKKTIKRPEPTLAKTPSEWAAYRCQLSCKLARQAIDDPRTIPKDIPVMEWAIYNLLHAVEELSKQILLK